MQYIIKTVDGATIPITKKQRDQILQEENAGKARVFVNDAAIRCNTMNIYPADVLDITEGVLHDGTRVIKHFGQWVDACNPKLRLDPAYYPEIASDTVVSRETYKKLGAGAYKDRKQLPERTTEVVTRIRKRTINISTE